MLALALVFLVFTILAGGYDWYVLHVLRTRKALATRGVRAVATISDTGTTTGAVAVTSSVVNYVFEPTPGQQTKNRVVLTSGLERPKAGDRIDIVYLPENPKHSQIVGNAGNIRTLIVPLVPLNVLWLLLLVSVFVETFDLG